MRTFPAAKGGRTCRFTSRPGLASRAFASARRPEAQAQDGPLDGRLDAPLSRTDDAPKGGDMLWYDLNARRLHAAEYAARLADDAHAAAPARKRRRWADRHLARRALRWVAQPQAEL
jgi:hypothetical protein